MVVKSPTRFKGATVENVQSYKDEQGAERVEAGGGLDDHDDSSQPVDEHHARLWIA